MTNKQLTLIKGTLAALSQPATHQADINYAKWCLKMALRNSTRTMPECPVCGRVDDNHLQDKRHQAVTE